VCRNPFQPRYSTLQPTCEDVKCIIEYSKTQKEKKEAKEWQKRKQDLKFDNYSSDGYRSKVIQPLINEIARLIDFGQPCIASGRYEGKFSGGHFTSVGANRSVSLNLHNIHIQTFESNSFRGGDETRYRHGLIKVYGNDYFEFVEGLRHIKGIDLSKQRLSELKPLITQIRNDLKRELKKYSPQERIELRNEINEKIGIYSEIFTN
jgi:hypothetical protein